MTVQLRGFLEHLLTGEPTGTLLDEEVDEIFRRADRLRRRRAHLLIAGGVAGAVAVAGAGYLITTTMLPTSEKPAPAVAVATTASAVPAPSATADPVLALITPLVDAKMHIYPRPPERGNGWRQYSVVDTAGEPHGTVAVAVYAAPDDLCFPVLSAPDDAASDECARPKRASKGIEYRRYDDDADWQAHQTIARRTSDGRTVAVMAIGERGTDKAASGKPALSGKQIQKVATDPRLADAFGPGEDCWGPSSGACPVFRVPVPAADDTERDKGRDDGRNKDQDNDRNPSRDRDRDQDQDRDKGRDNDRD